jgi:homeobox domain-containing protein
MSYIHHPYSFGGHATMAMEQSIASMQYPSVATPMDAYLYLHSQFDPAEYYRQLPMLDDYDELPENTSRPRLTKDQVDTLEAQFQAHPKPNSNIKRQLAVQTNLSLPRVAVREPFLFFL